jgi:hypothetical protein
LVTTIQPQGFLISATLFENTFGVGPREAIDFVGQVYKKRAALGLRVVVLGLKLP